MYQNMDNVATILAHNEPTTFQNLLKKVMQKLPKRYVYQIHITLCNTILCTDFHTHAKQIPPATPEPLPRKGK